MTSDVLGAGPCSLRPARPKRGHPAHRSRQLIRSRPALRVLALNQPRPVLQEPASPTCEATAQGRVSARVDLEVLRAVRRVSRPALTRPAVGLRTSAKLRHQPCQTCRRVSRPALTRPAVGPALTRPAVGLRNSARLRRQPCQTCRQVRSCVPFCSTPASLGWAPTFVHGRRQPRVSATSL